MVREWEIGEREVLLFKNRKELSPGCHLKYFIDFLVSSRIPWPINFSYVGPEGVQLSKLNLRQNICLDFIPSLLCEDKELHLSNHLRRRSDRHLLELYRRIARPDGMPSSVDDQTCKIASLLRGLLQGSPYLFLDCPEKYLSPKNTKLFFDAMEECRQARGLRILVYPLERRLWGAYADREVLFGGGERFVVRPLKGEWKDAA